jgi:hypothetical protein
LTVCHYWLIIVRDEWDERYPSEWYRVQSFRNGVGLQKGHGLDHGFLGFPTEMQDDFEAFFKRVTDEDNDESGPGKSDNVAGKANFLKPALE